MIRRLLTLSALFAACSAAQPPSANPSDQKPIRVEGRVLDLGGAPVRKANVHLQGVAPQPATGQPQSGYSQTSDDAGGFAFENVTPGRYTLTADKAGFLAARYGARSVDSPGVQLTFAPGDKKPGLDLKLIPQGVIVGRVLDQDGDPIANAQVTVARYGYSNGHRTLMPVSAITAGAGAPTPAQTAAAVQAIFGGGGQATDDQGVFRISNLPPGRYYVSADARGNRGIMGIIATAQGAAVEATSEPVSIVTWYPNTADASGAAPVIVAAGSEVRGIDIRVRKARVYSIRGKVVDTATGGPVSGAMVLVLPPNASEVNAASLLSNMTQSAADGGFEIRSLLPGTYSLQGLTIPGLAGLTASMAAGGRGGSAPAPAITMAPKATTRLDISVSASSVTGAVLQLADGAEIPGIVKMDEGNLKDVLAPATPVPPSPIPGLALPGPANRAIRLTSAEGVDLAASRGQFADDGAFTITGVFPGKYFVTLGAMPQGTYVKSISFAGREIARAPLDLTAGAAGSLEIVLSAKAADVSGTVRSEKGDPLQGVPVTLWPKTPDRSRQDGGIHTTNTDQNGSFKITGLAPGDYYVAAWDDIPEAGLEQNPDFLARFQRDDTAVKLTENGHASADAKLISRERVAAEVARMPAN